jgi:uncharacterized repeat protein (TIGR03803 family)
MKGPDFRRYALSAGLTMAFLSGCGGSQQPIAPLDSYSSPLAEPLGTYTSIYSFQTEPDGERPEARLFPFNGSLYGVTSIGGKRCPLEGCGTVFKITTAGHETILHRFLGLPDGAEPLEELASLKQDLYGTTYSGGTHCGVAFGCGTVFKLDLSGTERVLYRFNRAPDGIHPQSPLILVGNTFYGTTSSGGTECTSDRHGCGTVYAVTPSGQERVLYRFQGSPDGAVPTGDLTLLYGTLYGTTSEGGACGGGTVFAITPSGSERVVYSAGCVAHDMSGPSGLLSMDGVLYGTSLSGGEKGGGTVYAVTTGGYEHIVYGFNQSGQIKGDRPSGRLIAVNGLLYGTTQGGGAKYTGFGIVYSLTRSGELSVLYRFRGAPDGSEPYAGVTDARGVLYGTTYVGGSGCRYASCADGYGTVFRLTR